MPDQTARSSFEWSGAAGLRVDRWYTDPDELFTVSLGARAD